MFRILILSMLLTFQAFAGYAQAAPGKIEVETRFNLSLPPIKDSCKKLAARAEKEFKKSWQYGFDAPSDPTQIDLEQEETRLEREKKDGVHHASYLAPVGSDVIFLSRRQATGSDASLFVDCKKDQAFVSLRGGVVDLIRWFGPFQL